jgi:hypothetical protein
MAAHIVSAASRELNPQLSNFAEEVFLSVLEALDEPLDEQQEAFVEAALRAHWAIH